MPSNGSRYGHKPDIELTSWVFSLVDSLPFPNLKKEKVIVTGLKTSVNYLSAFAVDFQFI